MSPDHPVSLRFAVIGVLLLAGAALSLTLTETGSDDTAGDLVGHWRFDAGGGTTAHDVSGNGNNGTLSDGINWTDGRHGAAIQGSSVSGDSVDIASPTALEVVNVSVAFWFQPGNWSGNSYDGTLVRKYGSGSGRPYWLYGARPGDELTFERRPDDGTFHALLSDKTDWKQDEWYHVVAQHNNATDTWQIYVNGELDAEKTEAITPSTTSDDFTMALGSFNGTLDDVRVYDRPLPPEEIKTLYNHGGTRFGVEQDDASGTVLDITFDQWNDTHVLDTSGQANHGTPENSASQETAVHCKTGRCYRFDPSQDQYVSIPDDTSLDIQDSITLMAWVKSTPDSIKGDYPRIISKRRPGGFELYIDNDERGAFFLNNTANTQQTVFTSGVNMSDGTWHHITAAWNGTHQAIYADGVLQDRQAFSGTLTMNDNPLWIGAGGSGFWQYFNGKIDQVKVFDRALSQQEIVEEAGIERDGAILDLRFDTGAGTTLYDLSVHGNDGRLGPNASARPRWADGVTGSALRFDGEDGFGIMEGFDMSHVDANDSFALSGWFKATGSGAVFGATRNAFAGDADSNAYIYLDSGQLTWVNEPGYEQGGNYVAATSSTGFNDGNWHHVYAEKDGYNWSIYVDGELESHEFTGRYNESLRSYFQVDFGAYREQEQYLDGRIDDFRLYDRALPDHRIKALYRQGSSRIGTKSTENSRSPQDPGRKNLVLYHTFDDVNRTHSLDRGRYLNHGVLGENVETHSSTSCQVGRCLEFDRTNVTVDASGSLNISDAITVSIWMNSRDDLGTTRRTEWVSKPGSYIMRNDERTDRCDIGAPGPMFHVQLNDSEFHGAGYCGDTPPDSGEWHHYVGVFDSDSRGVEFWEDGQRIHANRSVTGMTIQNSTEPLTIGAHQAGTNYFNGSIDQVRIYNRSLSAAEIWHLYSQGMYRKNTEHVAGPKAWWRFDGGPEVCILNEQNLQPGGWQAPSPSDLKSLLTDAGWTAQYVTTDDITQDRWTACDVIVFPNGEDYPAFDTSSDFCNGVNGEGTEHDIFAEMKEFVADGGLFVGTWGAGMWYPHAKNASGWQRYADDCSQYSGDSLYSNGGGSRCSDLGYSCYSDGDYEYGNINQGITPALPGTITDVDYNYRWASGLDINLLQAYNATSGSTISGKYVGLQRHGDGWWFHPGSNRLMDPGQSSYATDLWNNLLTWYAGGGEQRMFDDGPTGNPVSIQGDNNSVAYATDCVQGSCIDFSGSEDFLKSTNGVAMAPTDNSSFSMAAWIKTGQDGAIVGKTNDAFADGSSDSNIFLRTDSGTPTWQLEYNSSNDEDTLTGSTTVTDNNWHHVVGVRDGWNFTIYVDGEQDAHFTKSDYYVDDGYREYNTALNPDAAVDIGHYREQSTFFPGQIDDVRIYPYALTEAQVQTVMRDSAARFG